MSLALLLPIGLLALAALLLPLLLHLQRRTEPRPTPFAALRWLSMQARPQHRVRLEELWLLLLRLLLLATVAALFARPVLFGSQGGAPWVLVAPGVELAPARSAMPDPRAQWHWLARDFPAIDSARPASSQATLSLLREVDAALPAKTALTVFVPTQLDGLDGERPRLSRRIDWRIVAGGTAPARATPPVVAPMLFVRHAADRAKSLRYLRAAASSWHVDTTGSHADIAASTAALPGNARWLAWLVPGELPPAIRRWIEGGGIALLDERAALPASVNAAAIWRDGEGRVLARSAAFGRGRVIQLARPLLPAPNPQVLDGQFPAQLRALFDGPGPAPTRALAEALRPLPGGPTFPETPKPLDPWLAIVAAALFVLERWFASASRRRRAP